VIGGLVIGGLVIGGLVGWWIGGLVGWWIGDWWECSEISVNCRVHPLPEGQCR